MSSPPHPGETSTVGGSFRDPAGFVFVRDGTIHRHVARGFADQYDLLLASGLYDALVAADLLIPHAEVAVERSPSPGDAHRVLVPERIPFVSYPYEWCPGQLRDAALTTLRAQALALDHGMSLRDASAYNVQFHHGRAVLIDTLSFERRVEGRPWVAYRQFCRHFLAPLAVMVHVDVRLGQLQRTDVDGVPVDLASTLLPLRTRLRPSLLTHLHLQARTERTRARDAASSRAATVSDTAMRGLVDSLHGAVERLRWDPDRTTWSDYYAEADHYSDDAMADKAATVARYIERVGPDSAWDLGANTGRFSRLAAEGGGTVVAFDGDVAAVELHWRAVREAGAVGVLPLVLDLANPSPALGWANEERRSLTQRGPVDLVLALALVHHLAIGNNVPLPRIADAFADLAANLVIEFVPKIDPKVQALLATREDVFDDYHQDGFEGAFSRRFRLLDRHDVSGSDRSLYLFERV